MKTKLSDLKAKYPRLYICSQEDVENVFEDRVVVSGDLYKNIKLGVLKDFEIDCKIGRDGYLI